MGGTLWITLSSNQNLALTASYIYKRALHRAQSFSAAHHHNLFISWNSEFSQFSTTSPFACLWTILLFLFVVGGGTPPPPLAEDLLSTLFLVAFTIKIRDLCWPNIMPNNVDSIIANEALQQTCAPPCSSRLFVCFFQHPGNSLLQNALL